MHTHTHDSTEGPAESHSLRVRDSLVSVSKRVSGTPPGCTCGRKGEQCYGPDSRRMASRDDTTDSHNATMRRTP